jgi:hypothetical protein
VANLGETTSAAVDGETTFGDGVIHFGEAALENLETALHFESLIAAGVATGIVLSVTNRGRQATTNVSDPARETPALGEEVAIRELPGVFAGPSDRTCPAR